MFCRAHSQASRAAHPSDPAAEHMIRDDFHALTKWLNRKSCFQQLFNRLWRFLVRRINDRRGWLDGPFQDQMHQPLAFVR